MNTHNQAEHHKTALFPEQLRDREFMMQEHALLYGLYQHLYTLLYQCLKFYFGIVAIPISLCAVFLKNTEPVSAVNLFELSSTLAFVFFILALVGILFLVVIIQLRSRMIEYAKCVNLTRKYFVDQSVAGDLKKYLMLPITSSQPKFYEGFSHHFPGLVFLLAFLNSALLGFALYGFFQKNALTVLPIFALALLSQCWFYEKISKNRDARFDAVE